MFRPQLLVLLALLLGCTLQQAVAQFGMGKRPPPPKAPVNKADLKFIRCQVCEAFAKQAARVYKGLKEEADVKRVSEADVLERLEKMCDPDQNEGDWITQIDIVEKGDKLKLEDTGLIGKCKSECRTIARACEELSEEVDLTELSAALVTGKQRAAINQYLCYEASDVCQKKVPPVPADRKPGEAHQPMGEDELRSTKMLRDMKAKGLSGSLYDRDSMMKELDDMKEMYGDDEDFSSLLKEAEGKLKGKASDHADDSTRSASAAADSPAGGIADTVRKAAESLKDSATKVVEGVGEVASNLLNKVRGKKEEL